MFFRRVVFYRSCFGFRVWRVVVVVVCFLVVASLLPVGGGGVVSQSLPHSLAAPVTAGSSVAICRQHTLPEGYGYEVFSSIVCPTTDALIWSPPPIPETYEPNVLPDVYFAVAAGDSGWSYGLEIIFAGTSVNPQAVQRSAYFPSGGFRVRVTTTSTTTTTVPASTTTTTTAVPAGPSAPVDPAPEDPVFPVADPTAHGELGDYLLPLADGAHSDLQQVSENSNSSFSTSVACPNGQTCHSAAFDASYSNRKYIATLTVHLNGSLTANRDRIRPGFWHILRSGALPLTLDCRDQNLSEDTSADNDNYVSSHNNGRQILYTCRNTILVRQLLIFGELQVPQLLLFSLLRALLQRVL